MDMTHSRPTLAKDEISSGLIIHGARFLSTSAWVLSSAKECGLKLLVIDRFGELVGLASANEGMIVIAPVKRRLNPLKPFGVPGPFVLSVLYAAAFAVGKESPRSEVVNRAQELVMAGKEPTGVALAVDLLEHEIDELDLLVRPSSINYLGNREDFDMERALEHDILVDLSLVTAADEATLIGLTCLLRARALLKPGTSFVLMTHPDIFFSARGRLSPASVQFLCDMLSSLASSGIKVGLACSSPELVPPTMRQKLLVNIGERHDPPRIVVSSDTGTRSLRVGLLGCVGPPPDESEMERRVAPFLISSEEKALPPWLVSDFGDEAQVAVEVAKRISEEQPSLDETILWANSLSKGTGASVVGKLVRLRYASVEQAGGRTSMVLTEKGRRVLALMGGEKP